MFVAPSPMRETARREIPVRLRAAVIAGLRTACVASAQLLRRLDRDVATPEDPSSGAYA
ncbi:MAG: hypothetical protein AAGI52_16280 [Bacteroidota bacterium]